ncbi:MAG TPA: cupredoxin domain-containing protein [Thermoleophilaceae bacterium]|jgi:plastocyanin|nr:cupredoxin domain-containing protein [Thermoleophilaceae bacterium]
MNAHKSMSSLAVVAGAALLLAGCGGSSSGSAKPSASSTQTAVAGSGVTISNFKFSPATDTVKAGAGVTVTNEDSATHTVTADDGHSFDTGNLAHGGSQKISVSKPGSYSYHCTIHPFMHGTLVVK